MLIPSCCLKKKFTMDDLQIIVVQQLDFAENKH